MAEKESPSEHTPGPRGPTLEELTNIHRFVQQLVLLGSKDLEADFGCMRIKTTFKETSKRRLGEET